MNTDTTPAWYERLYDTKATELILYGRALGLSHAEAEDVVQETFLVLWQHPCEPKNPAHYCVRSFRNRALNYRRGFWRRLTRELESQRWFERTSDESPAERAAMRCLAELPSPQREVIVLKLWHNCTFDEIGELIDVSPNTAAGRYRYGLEKLRVCLKGKDYERDEQFGGAVAFLDPRHPSPRLERPEWRVAPLSAAPSQRASHALQPSLPSRWPDWPGVSWSIFARVGVPALACLALTAMILMQPGEGLIVHNADQPALIALALSNQNFAPYLSGSFQLTANRLDTFGWTNGGASPSSMRSLTPSGAIDLQ